MAKKSIPEHIAMRLTPQERVLLFCAASNTPWMNAGISDTVVPPMIVKELVAPTSDRLALTPRGRAVLQVLLAGAGFKLIEGDNEHNA